MTDPYSTLGLSPDCTPTDIRRAYRARAATLHPDASGCASADAFRSLCEARDLLLDPARRKRYDETGATANEPQSKPISYILAILDLFLEKPENLEFTDLAKAIQQELIAGQATIAMQLATAKREEKAISRLKGRFKRREKGVNLLDGVITQRLLSVKAKAESLERKQQELVEALALAKEFDFTVEPRAQMAEADAMMQLLIDQMKRTFPP